MISQNTLCILQYNVRISPWRAPSPNGLPNRAFSTAAQLIAPHLAVIFDQSIRLIHCPVHFRQSTTVALRKPGKVDRTLSKS